MFIYCRNLYFCEIIDCPESLVFQLVPSYGTTDLESALTESIRVESLCGSPDIDFYPSNSGTASVMYVDLPNTGSANFGGYTFTDGFTTLEKTSVTFQNFKFNSNEWEGFYHACYMSLVCTKAFCSEISFVRRTVLKVTQFSIHDKGFLIQFFETKVIDVPKGGISTQKLSIY